MKCNQRQMRLLKLLLSRQRYWTAEELASRLWVTSRTVKNDLQLLRQELAQYGIELQTRRGRGIRIQVEDPQQLQLLSEELSDLTHNLGGFRSDFQQRAFLIYRMIVNRIGYFTVEELAEKLNLSRSVINQEMPEVKSRLAQFHLTLKRVPYHGLMLEGAEIAIRAAIIDSFERNFSEDLSPEYVLDEYQGLNFVSTVTIRQHIAAVMAQYSLCCTPVMLDRMTIAVLVTRNRAALGKRAEEKARIRLKGSAMVSVMETLVKRMEEKLDDTEIAFLALYALVCVAPAPQQNRAFYGQFADTGAAITARLIPAIRHQWFHHRLKEEEMAELQRVILQNVIATEFSLYGMYYTQAIREACRMNSLMLDIACRLCLILQDQFQFTISRALIYSLTLYFGRLFSRTVSDLPPLPIYIVPNFDWLSGEMVRDALCRDGLDEGRQILVVSEADSQRKDGLTLVVDDLSVSGSHLLHIGYFPDEQRLCRQVRHKLAEWHDGVPELLKRGRRGLFTLKELTKNELFQMIAGLYNTDPECQMKTAEYLNRREALVSYENPRNSLAVIILFEQHETGFCMFRMKKPVYFKNWPVDQLAVFSLQKNPELIQWTSRLIRVMMQQAERLKQIWQDETESGEQMLMKLLRYPEDE